MSVAYCTIAVAMSATVHPGPEVNYDPAVVSRSTTERLMGIFNAMTTVFFAYGGHNGEARCTCRTHALALCTLSDKLRHCLLPSLLLQLLWRSRRRSRLTAKPYGAACQP